VQKAAEKARGRKLTLEEMDGGGITISNLGGIGGTAFTPIVNWPGHVYKPKRAKGQR